MMEKVILDGKVAVLYSPGYGAGWYSWHDIEELLFDPVIVDMVERSVISTEIIAYCEQKYPSFTHCYAGAEDLRIEWVPIGREFRIDEYDGSECIEYKDELVWLAA
jgi:hypothetical protein